ncbi:hypothetical protein PIB30_078226, partial [Stylosanthes scabra]|nr:hypothetical protein [Stylosanthes scabra]
WISGQKCRGRAQGKLKRTREARRMDKKPKKSPTQRRLRARALKMARPRPPFLNMEVSVGGAPARPRWCARPTPFRNAQDKDLARPHDGDGARPRGDGRTHLNEGYFGNFTFPGHGPSISQPQFDLYGEEQLKHNTHSLISSILALE